MDLNSNQKMFDPKKKEEGIASLSSFLLHVLPWLRSIDFP
jgi:hypothetical protein